MNFLRNVFNWIISVNPNFYYLYVPLFIFIFGEMWNSHEHYIDQKIADSILAAQKKINRRIDQIVNDQNNVNVDFAKSMMEGFEKLHKTVADLAKQQMENNYQFQKQLKEMNRLVKIESTKVAPFNSFFNNIFFKIFVAFIDPITGGYASKAVKLLT